MLIPVVVGIRTGVCAIDRPDNESPTGVVVIDARFGLKQSENKSISVNYFFKTYNFPLVSNASALVDVSPPSGPSVCFKLLNKEPKFGFVLINSLKAAGAVPDEEVGTFWEDPGN